MSSQSNTAEARSGRESLFYLFYLWHLEKIGLVDPSKPDSIPRIWRDGLPETRVAIIDSGCTTRHPNLPPHAIYAALDVAAAPEGVVYRHEDQEAAQRGWNDPDQQNDIKCILETIGSRDVRNRIQARLENLRIPQLVEPPDPADYFSGHGTACAGLIGGRKLKREPLEAAPTAPDAVLPYFGVNPYATIIPIATPYSHEIAPLITALLHAVLCGADVILMPRTVNDLSRRGNFFRADLRAAQLDDDPHDLSRRGSFFRTDLRATRFGDDPRLTSDKECFEHLFAAIAANRPVVLASGNEGADIPGYPASLACAEGAPFGADSLIVVGAANHLNWRSSYSNGSYETGVTVYGPSDDEEMTNARTVRRDTIGELDPLFIKSLERRGDYRGYEVFPFSVLALDAPGRLAGDEEIVDGVTPLPTRLLYSGFGGTSAASALVAGMISLMQAHRRKEQTKRVTGREAHKLLTSKRPPHEPVLQPGCSKAEFIQVKELIPEAE